MQRDDAIRVLQQHEADLKQMGVLSLYLFGSTLRGEQREDSDVDLVFDYERGKLGLFELMDIEEATTSFLDCKADIMTRDSIHPLIRAEVEQNAMRVF